MFYMFCMVGSCRQQWTSRIITNKTPTQTHKQQNKGTLIRDHSWSESICWKCDEFCVVRKDNSTDSCSLLASAARLLTDLISFTRRHKPACTLADLPLGIVRVSFWGIVLWCWLFAFFMTSTCLQAHNPCPNQDRRTKARTLFQSLAFPRRLGPAHEPGATTQPAKHKQSQSLIACDTCKNKPVHEVTPFRPLSRNAQNSCCSRTTYQN